MINGFDTDVAMEVGINAAILYKNIQFWCEKNRTNDINKHDGYYWTYNSMKAFAKQFPYFSEAQVRQALKILEEKGFIKSGNYNKASYDRTKWYADVKCQIQSEEIEDSICYTSQMELLPISNANDADSKPIPDINTNIKPDNDCIDISKPAKNQRFVPPTIEEVRDYCLERNNNVDSEHFVDYYSSNGWRVGKNPMKDWKAAVRTWEKNNYSLKQNNYQKPQYKSKTGNEFLDLLETMEDEE